jgi:hypothetical protein
MIIVVTGMITGTILISMLLQAIVSIAGKRRGDPATDKFSSDTAARIEERLSRIEQAVEATAVEVERISEGQRFTAKLLAERAAEQVFSRGQST